MDEITMMAIAAQLRQPSGEMAKQVGEVMNEGNKIINTYAIREVNPTEGDTILEIGMGNGFFVKDILSAHESICYVGCDYSPEMVAEATALNEEYIVQQRAQFIGASASSLPFETATFNKVFTVNTLYFWDDTAKTLAEIHRVLTTNGRLVIAVRPKDVMLHIPMTQYGFNQYSKEDIVTLLTENSFEVTNIVEEDEPEQEFFGEMMKIATLIVSGRAKN